MAFATKGAALVAVGFMAIPVIAVSAHAQPSSDAICASADSLFDRREIERARDAYLDLLGDSRPPCAIEGLETVAEVKRQESRLCAEGAKLASNNREDEAVRAYADALHANVQSECALKGLEAPPSDDSWFEGIPGYLPQFPVHLGAILLMVFVVFAIYSALSSLVFRRASLTLRPFADGAVEPKVGTGFSGLVEEQLIRVWRRERRVRDDGYNLDFVVADVELFSEEDALARAVGDMAQVDQLKLIAAVLSLIDSVGKRRRLAATGELLPAGPEGSGVALALYNRQQLEARGILWERAARAAGPAPEPSPPSPRRRRRAGDGADDSPPGPTPYYRFAGPAAAWVQYEAALMLDSRVGVITSSAESFSLLSTGIDLHRDNQYVEAAEKYAQALEIDPANVAALVNLALLLARSWGLYAEAIALLVRARRALATAYDRTA